MPALGKTATIRDAGVRDAGPVCFKHNLQGPRRIILFVPLIALTQAISENTACIIQAFADFGEFGSGFAYIRLSVNCAGQPIIGARFSTAHCS
jgi:hypothetical protein